MPTQIYTSIAANYIPKARVLARSVKNFHPDFLFHVVLCDAVPDWFSIENEPFDSLITLRDLGLENPEGWIFKHTLVELSTGVKGFALKKILDIPGCTDVLYLDPDIVVLSPLDQLLREFASASILLTPHIAEPETTMDAILDNELSVLQHGIYNLGFVGVKNSPEGRRFATWWSERLNYFCYDDIPRGLFTDQRWADLVPAYFSDHRVLRDAVYNVCTWNLTHRTVTGSTCDGFLVNDQPIVFYHFSGLDSGAQRAMLDKYGPGMPALYELREWYLSECERMGQSDLDQIRWAYGFFDNGERILKIHRKRYRDRVDLQDAFPNPFSTSEINGSYLDWFNRNDEGRIHDPEASGRSEFPIAPDYRVFVIAAPSDSTFVQESLNCISKRTLCRDKFYFVATPGAETSSFPDGVQLISFEASSYDELFAAVLERFGDKDAILIRAGAVPPEKWDLRLAWSAARQVGVATVSPVDRRQLDKAGTLSGCDETVLDSLCYLHRNPTDLEVASFSRDCVYVRADALRDIRTLQLHMYPSALVDGAARLRYSHLLASHVCVAWRRPRDGDDLLGNDSTSSWSLRHLRERIRGHCSVERDALPLPAKAMTGANLHIMHSWGGGLERWVVDYCRADRDHRNLVLKSIGTWGGFGRELHLYRNIQDTKPLKVWPLAPTIKATAVSHFEYAEILPQILQEHGIERIIVSSLIGHSLDALRQHAPTLFICHDYYPFCPALNITFGSVCVSCQEPRLAACTRDNPFNRLFNNVPAVEWLPIRKEFTAAVRNRKVALIAGSTSVRQNYSQLVPELAASFHVISHGVPTLQSAPVNLLFEQDRRLRVLILGRLSPNKGGLLFECLLPELLSFADVTLAGCGEHGDAYAENSRITIIPQYERERLPELIGELQPDLGLLLSVVPETFSYTLAELQSLAVPVLATGIGSFADRIEDGVTGLLCPPDPQAILNRLKSLATGRQILAQIHENLKGLRERSVEDMLEDYERVIPTRYSARAYFDGPRAPEPLWRKNLQLYWRTGQSSFREEDSTIVSPLGGDRQKIQLHFPRQRYPIDEMRLDFSKQPGFFLLHQLSLLDHEDNVIWQWNGDKSLLKSVVQNQILFIDSWRESSECLLYLTGSDPYLYLPIADHLLARVTKGGALEVEFALAAAEDHVEALVSSIETRSAATFSPETAQVEGEFQTEERGSVIRQLQRTIREGDLRIQNLEGALAGIKYSVSWRLTRPARALAAFVRKVKGKTAHPPDR
jgi:glycosyltransferase involved in cell wall biosynthesis